MLEKTHQVIDREIILAQDYGFIVLVLFVRMYYFVLKQPVKNNQWKEGIYILLIPQPCP